MYRTLGLLLIIACSTATARATDFVEHPSFNVDVMSILSKTGCNLGTCHGNLNGKGGFSLSLRGQDPLADYHSLVVASKGRRANTTQPERSLFLLKATGEIPHRGGVRFLSDSIEYRTLARWLHQGAPGPSEATPRVTRLEVTPAEAIVVAPSSDLQMRVVAHYSDGTSRDVTARACYELSNLNASVAADGVVERLKFGETTLIVRYLDHQQPIPIAFTEARPEFVWDEPEAFNEVDAHVFAKLKRLRINPSSISNDHVFVRRAYLDAIGRLPSADEAREFVWREDPKKRDALIDQLLSRPEFADFWALKWADMLRTEEKVLDATGVDVFHGWIRDSIAQAVPISRFVSELVTTTGSTYKNPASNFYRANRDAVTRGETAARLFLGTRLQCAKCHNHPFDRWTQDDYYRWSSIFSQIDYEIGENKRRDKLDKNEFVGEQIVLVSKQDEVRNPTTGKVAEPKFLGADAVIPKDDRLSAVADWITSSSNDLFVQTQVNFVWYQLMGRGIVDPIDDFRLTNPPSNPPLLDALSRALVESDFDLRHLVALIMKSRTYQLSAEPNSTNVHDETSFSRAIVRRLPAEVVLDMQSDVLDRPATFAGFPVGIRAVQIPGVQRKPSRDSAPADGDRFLKTFGKPDRIMACDCERSNETTLKQALVLLGDGLSDRLSDPQNRVSMLAKSSESDSEVIEQLYWTTLSRPPTEDELTAVVGLLDSDNANRATVLEDLTWALLNAKEFLFRR